MKKTALDSKAQDDDWKETKRDFYAQNYQVMVENGIIDFSTDGMKSVRNGEHLSYDEYLDIQYYSLGHIKSNLEGIYYDGNIAAYKGCISKKSHGNMLFKKLYANIMSPDGTGYDTKENHVWMDATPFKDFLVHDCVAFDATVYRYIKTGHGRKIDYSLCNPINIRKIPPYQLPSDDQIENQIIDDLLWENSKYHDVVDRSNWADIRNKAEYQKKFDMLKRMMHRH